MLRLLLSPIPNGSWVFLVVFTVLLWDSPWWLAVAWVAVYALTLDVQQQATAVAAEMRRYLAGRAGRG